MDERLKKQLAFALEIDKEKSIFRQTSLSGHGRLENDAEHAWHMAIMAYLLKEYVKKGNAVVLRSLNNNYADIPVADDGDVTVVAYLHKVLR